MTWLDTVRQGMEDHASIPQPPTWPKPENAQVIGAIPENVRPLYSFAQTMAKDAAKISNEARGFDVEATYEPNPDRRKMLAEQVKTMVFEAGQLQFKADCCMRMFWISVKDELQLWHEFTDKPGSLNVTTEWEIVLAGLPEGINGLLFTPPRQD